MRMLHRQGGGEIQPAQLLQENCEEERARTEAIDFHFAKRKNLETIICQRECQ